MKYKSSSIGCRGSNGADILWLCIAHKKEFYSYFKKNKSSRYTTQFMFWGHSLAHSCIFRFLECNIAGTKKRYTLFERFHAPVHIYFPNSFWKQNDYWAVNSCWNFYESSWLELTRYIIIIFLFPTQQFLPSVNSSQLNSWKFQQVLTNH